MGTKRRGTARRKTSPGQNRPVRSIARSRFEKIPIPPVPTFLQSTTRATASREGPVHDAPAAPGRPGAISDEEADLLLGVTSSAEAGAPALPESALTEDEADELLGLAPGPAIIPPGDSPEPARPVAPTEPARSGASGAAVLNELVEEIEKDLERDLDRHPQSLQARRYGRTVGCWVSPLVDPSDLQPSEAAIKKHEEGTQ